MSLVTQGARHGDGPKKPCVVSATKAAKLGLRPAPVRKSGLAGRLLKRRGVNGIKYGIK